MERPKTPPKCSKCNYFVFNGTDKCSKHYFEDNPHIQRPSNTALRIRVPRPPSPSICYYKGQLRDQGYNAECIPNTITTTLSLANICDGRLLGGPQVCSQGLCPCQPCWDRYQEALATTDERYKIILSLYLIRKQNGRKMGLFQPDFLWKTFGPLMPGYD